MGDLIQSYFLVHAFFCSMKCNQKDDDSACILCIYDRTRKVNWVDILYWWLSMNVNSCGSLQYSITFFKLPLLFFEEALTVKNTRCKLSVSHLNPYGNIHWYYGQKTNFALFVYSFINTAEAFCLFWTLSLRSAGLIGANRISKHWTRCQGKIHTSLVLILDQQTAQSHLFLTPRGLCTQQVYI